MPPSDDNDDKLPNDGVTRVEIEKPYGGWSGPIGILCVVANVISGSVLRQRPIYAVASSTDQVGLIIGCIVVTTLPFFVLYKLILVRRKNRLKSVPERICNENIKGAAEQVFRDITVSELRSRLPFFARLVRVGNSSCSSVVLHWDEKIPDIHPIRTPFEPQLLESPDSFLDESELPESSESRLDRAAHEKGAGDPRSVSDDTRARRVVKFVGFFFVVVSGLWVVAQIAISVRHRWVTSMLMPFTIMVLGLILLWGLHGLRNRDRWLVAPGAVVIRRSKFLKPDVKLSMFDRRNAVICAIELPIDGWAITLMSEAESAYRVVSSSHLKRILRAWLSPNSLPVGRLIDFE